MEAMWPRLLLCYLLISALGYQSVFSETDPQDAVVLRFLKDQWMNTPPNWGNSDDPCGDKWDGVICNNNSRVTGLSLSTIGLVGKLEGAIRSLTELTSLDLSFNPGLTGSLPPQLGDLQNLNILILAGCSVTGSIPIEIGNLSQLSFLALNSNNFTGEIPPSLGNLSHLYWLDLADNQLTGSIPVSTSTSPGLDLLKNAKHFHFTENQLSGPIPEKLFSSDMVAIHVLFDGNQLTGEIPRTIGYVQTLEVLRLDRNALTGSVPSNLNNLTSLVELNLAYNDLSGSLPNLTGLSNLNFVDLSNSSFDESNAPEWFSSLQSLTTLVMEYGRLEGSVPKTLFSLPRIQQVKLRNNAFNGTLDLGENVSQQLQLVDLQNNDISSITFGSGYNYTIDLILIGNPVCSAVPANANCGQLHQQTEKPYSTSTASCGSKSCPSEQKLNPRSCGCAYPYEGTLYFKAPSFTVLSNASVFHELEMSLWVELGLTPGSVALHDPFFNLDDYLQVELDLFPSQGEFFIRSEVQRIGFSLSNQTYKPPPQFGPYYFIAAPYVFHGLSSTIGIAIGSFFLVMLLVGLGLYILIQKKGAEKAVVLSRPFGHVPNVPFSDKDSVSGSGALQLVSEQSFSTALDTVGIRA